MPPKIYSSDDLPGGEWSSLTTNSIYSSPEFASLWRTMGNKEIFFLEEKGGKIEAGIAGVLFGKRFFRRFQSMADGLSGGPYFSERFPSGERRRFMETFFGWLKSERIIRADIHNPSADIDAMMFRRRETETHLITFDGESFVPPDSKVREHIRTGKRRGAEIVALDDEKYLDRFYELVLMTERRHHEKVRYPLEFFRKLLAVALRDSRILWLMVLSDGKIIGSRICFVAPLQLVTWQYYSDKSFSHLKPGYLLLDYIINYALERDIRTVNLGWSPPDSETLISYKERWGGKKHTFTYYTYLSRIGQLVYGWR